MKLRIAQYNSEEDQFVVQIKHWLLWNDMYFDPQTKTLHEEQAMLGDCITERAAFDDFHEAHKYARIFKQRVKHKIHTTWEV